MRNLVACDTCRRQYDATDRPVGARFRCGCGGVITVTEPQAHFASVVRCSGCGGPREGQAESCGYCGASFTLHERDLNTICPGCLARVSDQASFCHHCATAIVPDNETSEQIDLGCPACVEDHKLFSRHLTGTGFAVYECDRCAGLWVGAEAFRRLEHQAKEKMIPGQTSTAGRQVPGTSVEAGPHQTGNLYRRCIECGTVMNRQNYGRKSGVIIDVCRDHGIWFDDSELKRILDWLREGGYVQAQTQFEEARRVQLREARIQQEMSRPSSDYMNRGASSGSPFGMALSDLVVDVLSFL